MRFIVVFTVLGIIGLLSLNFMELSFAFENKYNLHFVSSSISSSGDNDNDDDDDNDDGMGNNSQDERLQICCTWSAKLSDGILTYSINAIEEESMKAIDNAIDEWDKNIEGLQLIEESNPKASDIQIVMGDLDNDKTGNQYYDFKKRVDKDLTLLPSAGWTQLKFDREGFIDSAKITISEDVITSGFDDYLIEQIAKHELGHALGLGHANNEQSLMANLVLEDKTNNVSECEISGVITTNGWKLIQSKQKPEHSQTMFVPC
jgi:hypothetical protein